MPLLRQAGHEAVAVDLPGDDPAAGLPEYTDLVVAAIGNRGNVVLVAQSLGGFTAPLAAARVPVVSLVFVNAMIPRPGETPGAWWNDTGWDGARVTAAERGGYGAEFDLATYFLHDVPPEVAAAGEPYQRPEADVVFASACDFTAWPPVPIRAVAGRGRPVLPGRLSAGAGEGPAGHRGGRAARGPPHRPGPARPAWPAICSAPDPSRALAARTSARSVRRAGCCWSSPPTGPCPAGRAGAWTDRADDHAGAEDGAVAHAPVTRRTPSSEAMRAAALPRRSTSCRSRSTGRSCGTAGLHRQRRGEPSAGPGPALPGG